MDKKGKLFGKINIIDLLALIVVAVVLVAVALKMTGRMGAARQEVGTDIIYTVQVENVQREVYENILAYIDAGKAQGHPGDRLMASGELLSGYVTGVTATPREKVAEVVSSSVAPLLIYAAKEDRVDLVFTVEAYVPNNIKTELGTQEVRVGKTHIVKTTHFELPNATILSCEWVSGTGADN